MKKTLFIGNGLNRIMNDNISWDDLLNFMIINNKIMNPSIPLPIKFECLINNYSLYNDINENFYDDCKHKIINHINKQTSLNYDILKYIDIKNIDSIITTNYDLNIEKFYNLNITKKISGNTKYCIDKTTEDVISIYHPHGICTNPKTICLGYEHYCSIIEKCRTEINKLIDDDKYIFQIIKRKAKNKFWFDDFFTNNIFFVGFGLALSEIDIWWLLSYRASIISTNRENLKNNIINKIIFYDILNTNVINYEKLLIHDILSSMFVEVRVKYVKNQDEYFAAYKDILLEINEEDSKNGNKRN